LDESRAIFRRAGLEAALWGFVPPAWLLSREASLAVQRGGFTFYERMGGIVYRDAVRAHRLIGFASLTGPEARVTAAHAHWQSNRPAQDTRFAIHPADLERPSSVAAVRRALERLLDKLEPRNYADFLQSVE
jgi:predicted deacetylase